MSIFGLTNSLKALDDWYFLKRCFDILSKNYRKEHRYLFDIFASFGADLHEKSGSKRFTVGFSFFFFDFSDIFEIKFGA